jgi:integrase
MLGAGAAALALRPANALRRWTYYCLFGLIAVTGMRLSEAINLQRDDVDLASGILTVRQTKFGKSRLIPLHPTTRAALRSGFLELAKGFPDPEFHVLPIVEPGAAHVFVVERKPERLDKMQRGIRGKRQTPGGTRVVRDLGLYQNDVKHQRKV